MSAFGVRTILAGVLLALAIPARSFALDPAKSIAQFIHTVWQARDGLPQNTITAIAQTPDGYLWLGTRDGLARFDGVRFTVFTSDNTPALTQNQIISLLTDRSGRLWIGTWGGGVVRLEAGQFTRFGANQGVPNELVLALTEDRRGRVWIGTDGGGVAVFDGQRFVAQMVPSGMGAHVRALAPADDGVWAGTDLGLSHVASDGSTRSHTVTTDEGARAGVRALFVGRSGKLWIGSDHGLYRFEGDAITGYPGASPLAHDLVFAIAEDAAGSLWVGTDARGLRRVVGDRIDTFTSKDGLSNDSVLSVFEDRQQNLWVGTNLGGVNRLRDGPITPFGQREGLANDYARAIYQARDGALWMGTEGSGVTRLADGRITSYSSRDGLSNDTVFAITEDAAGAIWLGTDSGLTRFADGRMVSVTRNTKVANESVLALAVTRDGSIWMGTYAAGLVRYRDGNFVAFNTTNGFPHNTVNVIHEAADGTLWIGTRGAGLVRMRDGVFTTYSTKEGLSDNLVFSIREEAGGTLWIGTYGGGLNRFRGQRFASVTRRQGLFDDVIHRIVDDEAGRYWISTNRGIFSVRKEDLNAVADGTTATLESVAFGRRDGMRDAECNGGGSAGTRTRDGRIWFPTIAGVVSFDPTAMLRPVAPPPVIIEEVAIDGTPSGSSAPLSLPPTAQTLAVNFTAPNLSTPEITRFRYRLDGLESDWVDANSRRTAYYSKLPPGRYTFRVAAAIGDGAWAEDSAALQIQVAPDWFETWWFRAALAVTIVIGGVLISRLRVRTLTAQKAALERQVVERTAQLAAANERLSQLAREDGLTGLLNRRGFDQALDAECRRAVRAETPVALLLIDIDAFKAFNDRHGHQAGDACLRAVADAVRQTHRRAGEVVARYGGEELAVIVPGVPPERVSAMAEHVRQQVEALAIPHHSSPVSRVVTISVGASSHPGGPELRSEALVAAADRALYEAKSNGRNRVAVG